MTKSLGIIAKSALAVLVFLAAPIVLVFLLFRLVGGGVAFTLWQLKYGLHGKSFLVVYSDSPKWGEYIKSHVVPLFGSQAVVVNISTNPQWKSSHSIERFAHRHWGGERSHTPIVLHFTRLGRVIARPSIGCRRSGCINYPIAGNATSPFLLASRQS